MLHLHPITEGIQPATIPIAREATAHLPGQAHPRVIQVLQGHTRHQVQEDPGLVAEEETIHHLQEVVVAAQAVAVAAAEEEESKSVLLIKRDNNAKLTNP